MSEGQGDVFGPLGGSVFSMVCPAARRADCSLRRAALDAAPGRNELKESRTECKIEIFLSLARGHRIAVRDHETGALWRGWVDVTFPDHGFVWVVTDVGERKLLDIGVHTVWRPEESPTTTEAGSRSNNILLDVVACCMQQR